MRLFAQLRERAGRSEVEVELPEGAVVRDAIAAVGTSNVMAGAAGPIAFDARHDVIARPVVVATVGTR